MLARLAQPICRLGRRGVHGLMDTANVTRQFNVSFFFFWLFFWHQNLKGKFNTYPPKKVYYGKGNMSGEVVMVAGFCAFLFSFQQLVAADYMHNSYCMSSSHFNMGECFLYLINLLK